MKTEPWTLENLIDFELLAAQEQTVSPVLLEKIHALSGDPQTRKRRGLKLWSQAQGEQRTGSTVLAALSLAVFCCCLLGFCSAAATAWGTYSSEHNGIHVMLFLALALFVPWLIFLLGMIAMMFRRKLTPIHWFGSLLLKLAQRWAKFPPSLAKNISEQSQVFAWHLSARLQTIALCYHLGAVAALVALVSFRHIRFYWESTTRDAMTQFLDHLVTLLSWPWAQLIPSAVPQVSQSRWIPGQEIAGTEQQAWWPFLCLCLLCWGMVPRLLLLIFSAYKKRQALAQITFEAPHHRKLWRALDGVKRSDRANTPIDSALVIDVGGIYPDRETLRPFFLQQLRLNPVAWESSHVLDPQQHQAAEQAMKAAHAGIVLLTESWALSPPEMRKIIDTIRSSHQSIRLVILCLAPEHHVQQKQSWVDFVDGLNDAQLELTFYPPP